MKMKRKAALFLAAVLTLTACSQETGLNQEDKVLVTLRAYQEGAPGTRTLLLDGGTQVYWEANEAIKVFFQGAGSRFVSQNSEATPVASFTGYFAGIVGAQEGAGSQNSIWGLYPYREDAVSDGVSVTTVLPAEQVGREDNFAPDTHITLAKADGLDLAFYNVGGGLRFSLSQEGIRRVELSGNQDEPLAGTVKLAFEDGIPVIREMMNRATVLSLTAPDGEAFKTGVWYYLEALPCTLSKGFTMTFHKESGSAQRVSSEAVSIRRGCFGSLPKADEGLVFPGETPVPQAIDLGLGVLWSSWNLGAAAPEGYGEHYAWGETKPKTDYDWSTYLWCKGTENTLTKYCFSSGSGYEGYTDTRTVLEPEDDAASVNLGGTWRMPTREEWNQLSNSTFCEWTYTSLNGVNGFLITSKKTGYEGNSIFLPAASLRQGTNPPDFSLGYGNYWSSTASSTHANDAYQVDFKPSGINWTRGQARSMGFSVRPVCERADNGEDYQWVTLSEELLGNTRLGDDLYHLLDNKFYLKKMRIDTNISSGMYYIMVSFRSDANPDFSAVWSQYRKTYLDCIYSQNGEIIQEYGVNISDHIIEFDLSALADQTYLEGYQPNVKLSGIQAYVKKNQ